MFDVEEQLLQLLIEAYCFLLLAHVRSKPALDDTFDAIMQELTHQYVMINCVERF